MTTKVLYYSSRDTLTVSGSPEKPVLKTLKADEGDTTLLIDLGVSALVVDSIEVGGRARSVRSFLLNAQNPKFDPKKERIYLPYVKEIEFQGKGKEKK